MIKGWVRFAKPVGAIKIKIQFPTQARKRITKSTQINKEEKIIIKKHAEIMR